MSNKNIINYMVIWGRSNTDLNDSVRRMLKDGWQPLQGANHNGIEYFQTMVKYESLNDDEEFETYMTKKLGKDF